MFATDYEKAQKGQNQALKKIAEYLKNRTDIQEKLDNTKKSLEECFKYIIGEAKKKAQQNCAFLTDDEVFGLAVHYYDEESIVIEPVKAAVHVSTEEETKKLKEEVKEVTKEVKKKPKPKNVNENQMSLFDF